VFDNDTSLFTGTTESQETPKPIDRSSPKLACVIMTWMAPSVYSSTLDPGGGIVIAGGRSTKTHHPSGLGPKGGGFLGRGSQPPPHQLGDLGQRCKLPSTVWGRAPA